MFATVSRRLDRTFEDPGLRRVAHLGALLGMWAVGIGLVLYSGVLGHGGWGMDSHAYWLALQSPHPYGGLPGTQDAFLYPPPFLEVLRPFGELPWPAFLAAWAAIETLALLWLLTPLPLHWRVPALLLGFNEVQVGNVYALMALSLVLGFRASRAWSVLSFTKVTPVFPVVAWLVVRRDWTRLALALSLSGALAAWSFLVDQPLWCEWVQSMTSGGTDTASVPLRCAVALLLAALAARHHAVWLLPVCLMLAVPTNGISPSGIALLAALPRLLMSTTGCRPLAHHTEVPTR